jgi:hypothetical protein
MAYFAKIEDGVVTNVVRIEDEHEENGSEYLSDLLGGTWLQTSYNNNIRKNYAGIGYTYREDLDAFIAPKTFENWVLDEETGQWVPPTPKPNDGKDYRWSQDDGVWVATTPVETLP